MLKRLLPTFQPPRPTAFRFVLICGAIFLFAATAVAERLPIKTYTIADGLMRDLVTRIRQDSRGFLWFCTEEGLSRFDGVAITNFTTADGLPHPAVNDFVETANGTIYVATNRGVARLNPHGRRNSSDDPLFIPILPENPKSAAIQVLFEDREKRIWAGTSDGLYKLIADGESTVLERVPLGSPLPGFGGAIFEPSPDAIFVDAIAEDNRGDLWIGTFGSGLFRIGAGGAIRQYRAGPGGFGDNKVTALMSDRDGRIWLGMRSDDEGGVCWLDPGADDQPVSRCFSEKNGLGSNRVRDIRQMGDGSVWIGMAAGLCRWQGPDAASVCKTYTEVNDLCRQVYSLTEDHEGNLWTGSPCGAKRLAKYGVTTFRDTDGLPDTPVNAMFENAEGDLFATNFPGDERAISRFDGERFTTTRLKFPSFVDYHGWGWRQTVWQDSKGAWWIPTGYGLFRSPDRTAFEDLSRAALAQIKTSPAASEPFRVFEDSRGDIWMAATGYTNQLFRWERARNLWHDHTAEAGFTVSRIGTAFAEDRSGNVWIGASSDHEDGALIRYRNGEFRIFTAADGVSAGWNSDIYADSRGALWIATSRDGLMRLKDPNADRLEFDRFTPSNGLASITANCVTEDEFGRIYAGTWRGVDRLTPETGQIENFSNADGLPSGYVESAYRDRQNNLWFMTSKGLARFRPEPPRQRRAPNILITAIKVNGEARDVSVLGETSIPRVELNSDQRQVTVEFIGLGTSVGEKLQYEYRFGDGAWNTTDGRSLNFANLASGDYRLEVRAQTTDGIYSQEPANVTFRIAAPLWQNPFLILIAVILIALLVYSFYRYRLNKLVEIERTRTRIATDLHDDIGANLSKISLLSEIVNMQMESGNPESKKMLSTIAEVSRSSVASMRDIVWAINPSRDSVLEMTRKMRQYAEETFVPNNVALRFNAPNERVSTPLPMDLRREMFLIFKEAVNNAARHSDCTRIEIDFVVSSKQIVLQITDNGRGFDPGSESEGNGLANMRSRTEKIGGRFEIDSEPGGGTKIRIEV